MRATSDSLTAQIDGFLSFKRSLGYKYSRAEFWLRAFDRFAQQQSVRRRSGPLLDELIRSWLARNADRKPVSVTLELGVMRQFCAYLRRRDPTVIVPTRSWAPQSTTSNFLPYILEVPDIKKLLRLAAALGRPRFRARLYRTLLLTLYCTGLRFGEALRLRLRDVDLRRRALWIAQSKGRARWVPFHASLARELARYLSSRRAYAPAAPEDALFPRPDGSPVRTVTASATVRALLRRARLKPPSGRVGPRPYDLRHAFAVHRLERWYRAGVAVQARLPWLSAYLGHDDILGTEVYLTATPQLLELAARRLKRRLSLHMRWP
jgi:integrase/recombinase XerD